MNLIRKQLFSQVGAVFIAAIFLSSCVTTSPEQNAQKIIREAQEAYRKTFSPLGINLVISLENSDRDNVTSKKKGKTWEIKVYEGFVKNKAINKNALKLAICHEAGHLTGPKDAGAEYADEKIADVFAVVSCYETLAMSKASISDGIESLNTWYKIYPTAYGYPTPSERWEIMLFTLAHLK
jgi:hypothetical protein